MTPERTSVIELRDVGLRRDGRDLLRGINWTVTEGERWVVLGPNGAGKSTLLRLASLWEHPTTGTARVLGEELGRTDVRPLRSRIGVASAAMADQLRGDLVASDVVMTGRRGALEPWWHTYDQQDRDATTEALDLVGIGHLSARRFSTLSSGERQRVQLARTLAARPDLLLLDEPSAGLDLGAREELLARLTRIAAADSSVPLVLVTHHVEEIPVGFTHVLLISGGSITAQGPLSEDLTAETLSRTFGLEVELSHDHGRWRAWATA